MVKLSVAAAQGEALEQTLLDCNRAADLVSDVAQQPSDRRAFALQKSVYAQLKDAGLSAQPAIRVIKKVAHAYAAPATNLKAGNYGRAGSKRYAAVAESPIRFRALAAQTEGSASEGTAVRHRYQPSVVENDCRSGATHRAWYRDRGSIGYPRSGTAGQETTSAGAFVGVRPATRSHQVQGGDGGCARAGRRPAQHLAYLLTVWVLRCGEPPRAIGIPMPRMWVVRPRGPQRRPRHRRPRTQELLGRPINRA